MKSSAACSLSLIGALVCFHTAAWAQSAELSAQLDRMAASSGVEAHFEEHKELSLLAAPLVSRGVIYFVPPDRFARFTSNPGFTSLLVSGDDVRLREGRDAEVIDLTGNPLATVFVDNIVVLWSGDRRELERQYATEYRGDAQAWELVLSPRNQPLKRAIASITLRGDTAGMQEMVVSERDGDSTTTRFEAVRSDRSFTPAELARIFGDGVPLSDAPAAP